MKNKEVEGYDSRAVANRFVQLAEKKRTRITISQLFRFVYLAHGWNMGYYGSRLIAHSVRMEKIGPVVQEVYDAFRPQGIIPLRQAQQSYKPCSAEFTDEEEAIIAGVFSSYEKLPHESLKSLLMRSGTPWNRYRDEDYGTVIPTVAIREYYRKKVNQPK